MEITFTKIEIEQLKNAGSNIGNFLNKRNHVELRDKIFSFTKFLPESAFVIQRVWHVINNINDTVKCEMCTTGITKWSHNSKSYRHFCCIKCSRKQSTKTAKITFIKNYGVDNPLKNKEIKERVSATMQEKYGTRWYCSTDDCQTKSRIHEQKYHKEICNKREKTNLERFGIIHPSQLESIKNKAIETNIKRYNVPYSSQNPQTRQLSRDTSIERYGFPYAVQNAEIHDKNMKNGRKYRDYILPSGKLIQIQGWENKALDILLKNYQEDELITERTNMPEIWYINRNNNHRYYPDIYIPKENKIIEVKSVYTYNNALEINLLKQKASIEHGYNFEFIIF